MDKRMLGDRPVEVVNINFASTFLRIFWSVRLTMKFIVLQGLPVFKYANPPTNISFNNCHFGMECYQKLTEVKSRVVLQLLKLGYNVLLSDVDVYQFKNPLPFISSFGSAVLLAQSDEYNITGQINLPWWLNSGFYYAHRMV